MKTLADLKSLLATGWAQGAIPPALLVVLVLIVLARDVLAHRLAHPRYGVKKTYVADVDGEPPNSALRALSDGIELDDGRTAPARARRLAPSRVELTLHEGRKHQVKRMLAAVGHPVRRLHRSAYAGIGVEGLDPGRWRELTADEVARLTSLASR